MLEHSVVNVPSDIEVWGVCWGLEFFSFALFTPEHVLLRPSRRRGEEPPAGHPHRYRVLAPDLLRGVLRRLRRPDPHDAVLHAGQQQPVARGVPIRGLGGG